VINPEDGDGGISETFVFNSTLTRLITGEDFSTAVRRERFRSNYSMGFFLLERAPSTCAVDFR
jgi:hypothetical protein